MEERDKLLENSKKLKVLYVEDSLTVRNLIYKILSNYFDHIDLAGDGKEGVEKYSQFYNSNNQFYDILFTDLEMPLMDGKELSQIILDFNKNQEIVVISSVDDFKVLTQLINIGVNKYIAKPVDEEQVYEVIRQVVTNIKQRKNEELDRQEILEHNEILLQKQEENTKIIEEKVIELESFTNALMKSAMVVRTDTNGCITYINERFCNVCGYTQEELIGQKMSVFKSGTRSQSFYKKLWNTISNKKTYTTLFENLRKDGSTFFIETTINPILNSAGDIVEFVGVSHDMTQLIQSNQMIKQAQKSKDDFFINVSHEMKTPLNSVLGFASLLQKRLDDEKSLMMVNTILQTGNDLKNLIESIIDMKKIKENTLQLNKYNFNPYDDFKKYLEKYQQIALDNDVTYELNLHTTLPKSLIGDSVRISQLLGIFIDNGIKFSNKGGKVDVLISYDDIEKILICEVQDNGIGIAKEDQERIFKLEQVEGDRNRTYEGAGIGLSIASGLANTMKGTISLKSLVGKGSLFTVELPIS